MTPKAMTSCPGSNTISQLLLILMFWSNEDQPQREFTIRIMLLHHIPAHSTNGQVQRQSSSKPRKKANSGQGCTHQPATSRWLGEGRRHSNKQGYRQTDKQTGGWGITPAQHSVTELSLISPNTRWSSQDMHGLKVWIRRRDDRNIQVCVFPCS